MSESKKSILRNPKFYSCLILILSVFTLWSWVHFKTDIKSWSEPVMYEWDGIASLSYGKAYSQGEIFPAVPKYVSRLNAPYTANWNDFPLQTNLLYLVLGVSANFIGLIEASNLILLLAFILNAVSFWYVGTKLKYNQYILFVCSILFSFQLFAIHRSLHHITVTYYFVVPLFLLVVYWLFSKNREAYFRENKLAIIITCILTGLLNPYNSWLFLQFVFFALITGLIRKQKFMVKASVYVIALTLAAFFVVHIDYIIYGFVHGRVKMDRNLGGLILYGLKIPDLISPFNGHRDSFMANFGMKYYNTEAQNSEMYSQYIGIIAITGLIWLIITSFYRILKLKFNAVPTHFWQVLWVLLYSIVGGINLVLGQVFNLTLFRCTNRYSIVIAAIALLFLARQLSKNIPKKYLIPLSILILFVGIRDQVPRNSFRNDYFYKYSKVAKSDKIIFGNLEKQLPNKAMVFQMPVMEFPESAPINRMQDYENFRPYIFTNNLRFSYGNDKGRFVEQWQYVIEKQPASVLVGNLEKYGFDCLLVNRKGYKDNGDSLVEKIVSTGRHIIFDDNVSEIVAFRLTPSKKPVKP